jgi:hypothetical protein
MSYLHRRVALSINMQELKGGSQAPLLSSASNSSDEEYDVNVRVSYGSATRKGDPFVIENRQSDDSDEDDDAPAGAPAQGGVQQADAINKVWSRAALVTAYLLYASNFSCSRLNHG